MKIVFLGTGEAFDPKVPTACFLLEDKINLLLDCGYSSPAQIWQYNNDPDFVDAIYISHIHGDHVFGLAPYLRKLWEQRRKPLTIICQAEDVISIKAILDFGYKGMLAESTSFPLDFIGAKTDQSINFQSLKLTFAATIHPVTNFAVRVDNGQTNFCYSGDGELTPKSIKLFSGTHLLMHDGYLPERTPGIHAGINDVIAMAEKQQITKVALIHLQAQFRHTQLEDFKHKLPKGKLEISFPLPYDQITL